MISHFRSCILRWFLLCIVGIGSYTYDMIHEGLGVCGLCILLDMACSLCFVRVCSLQSELQSAHARVHIFLARIPEINITLLCTCPSSHL